MELHNAAALLTTHAQHAYTLQGEAGAALALRTKSDPRRLARLAHRAERAAELAMLWDGVLWEAHGTHNRDHFPLADPARVVAAARTLRTLTRDGITRAYDLTCAEFHDHAPERPAGHWAARLFLLHTNIVDHLPGAATAPAVLAELHARLSDGSGGIRLPAGTTAALELVTALREGLDAAPVAARDIPARSGEILIRALALATFQGCSLSSTGTGRTAVLVPLVDGWKIQVDDAGSAEHAPEDHGSGRGSQGWTARLYDPDGEAIDVVRHPSPDTADDCLADSAACVRQLAQWRAENQAKGPVQD
ncbi:hypothetical protein OHB35_53275 [Streptomyces phaeochromogenes]|uniref:Uncharacterized protein n=1 Tax=Streptomyces phaeochromogenes TaxID=1923 RepID=A0ABZ1HVI0_STRPH|nr:hypothetical protein [Streptomyces phaeochromogenes]WSD11739.1 hypothetical protein OHB35_00060 [Streptomyces phaeochromogenes]WSD21310.1 hypothetical protein OHB35_53275 [Streptomyces phaeochromogenes]